MKPLSEMGRYATVVIDPPWPMDLPKMRYWGVRERPEHMS